ncbi:MAG: hypothetical protein ACTSUK_00850 [Promethearchaeota archaeon]
MLFFDLEFFVPPEDRFFTQTKGTFKFDPTKKGHLLLGGYFLQTSLKDLTIQGKHSIWIWKQNLEYLKYSQESEKFNENSEKKVIEQIYEIFLMDWKMQQKQKERVLKKRIYDCVTCGFSISRIDLPVLFLKGIQHNIADQDELFRTFLNTKTIDLSNTSSFLFPEEPVLYPKTQLEVVKRLEIPSFGKSAGSEVWSLFDKGDYHGIAERCRKEVEEIKQIYRKIQTKISSLSSI